MRISRITATAVLALCATAFTTTVTHAEPAPPPAATAPSADPLALRGSFHEIAYQVAPSEDRRSTVTTIQDGRFDVARDGKIVTLTDRTGQVVAAFPMALRIGGQRIGLSPVIDETGTQLSVQPVARAEAPLRDVSAEERFFTQVERTMPTILAGAGIGGAIGFLLGFPLGLFVVDFITIPITTVIGTALGAFVGLAVGGGQPAVEAAVDYFDTMP
ncbi:hypothetical protein [Nocardia sp. NPDC052566]|uniref:hypothetical protein n=1 Tax=Nocardia sp. NPDC052566 TaxID=3364330 RepID=UPI0037CAD351